VSRLRISFFLKKKRKKKRKKLPFENVGKITFFKSQIIV
jgi:hypothetical protein